MMIGRIATLLLLFGSVSSWMTGWDAPFYHHCPPGQHLNRIQSAHDNHKEDRVWNFYCANTGAVSTAGCALTGYLNGWDAPFTYVCPGGKIMTGLASYHSNHHEDRRWRVLCCNALTPLHQCHWSGYTNGWDGPMDARIGNNAVFTGITSTHSNHKEDRLYRFHICSKKPINGNWGGWGAFSACPARNCGTMTRTRACNNPSPLNGGAYCPGSATDTRPCVARCPVDIDLSMKVCKAGFEGKPGMCNGKVEDVQPVCTFAAPIDYRNCNWNLSLKKYTCPDANLSQLKCCKYTCITHADEIQQAENL